MSNSYAVRPVGGAAENGQPGSHSVSRPANAPNPREGQGADFLRELTNLLREDAPALSHSQNFGQGANPQNVNSKAAAESAQNAEGPAGQNLEGASVAESSQNPVDSAALAADALQKLGANADLAAEASRKLGAASEDSGQNLPPHAGSLKLETRGANVTSAYKTIQDRARPSTALAPWGTGISHLV